MCLSVTCTSQITYISNAYNIHIPLFFGLSTKTRRNHVTHVNHVNHVNYYNNTLCVCVWAYMCVCAYVYVCVCECVKVCRAYGRLPLLGGVRRIGRHLRTGCGVGVEAPVAALQGVRQPPQLSTPLVSTQVYFSLFQFISSVFSLFQV